MEAPINKYLIGARGDDVVSLKLNFMVPEPNVLGMACWMLSITMCSEADIVATYRAIRGT